MAKFGVNEANDAAAVANVPVSASSAAWQERTPSLAN